MEATKYVMAFENFDKEVEEKELESTEETLKKIWEAIDSGEFCSIISSYCPGTDPDTLAEEHEELKNDVLKLKFGYLEMCYGYEYSDGKGQTNVKKRSLFVPGLGYKDLLALGKKYQQETIAFCGNGGISVVRVSDQKVVLEMNVESMKLAWNFLLTGQQNIPW